MDMTIKTLPTAAPAASPAATAVSPAKAASPASGASQAPSSAAGSAEAAAPATTEPDAFARALQLQLDMQPAPSALAVAGEEATKPDAPSESTGPTPVDLGALLSGLQAAPALVQAGTPTADGTSRPESAKPEGIAAMLASDSRPAEIHIQANAGKAVDDRKIDLSDPANGAKDETAKSAVTTEWLAALNASESRQAETPATDARIETAPAPHATTPASVSMRAEEPRLASIPAVRVDKAVNASGWPDELGQKLNLLIGRDEHRAEIILNPPHLGRLEVTLSVNNDQASALFVSANPAVREALEQALPRLREALADAGVALGQASVNAETSRDGQDGRGSGKPGFRSAMPEASAAPVWLRRADGLVDTFV